MLAVFLAFYSSTRGASYYIDFASGDDTNNGTSTNTPWKRCPGDAQATGLAKTRTPVAGDTFYFKRGVTYDFTGSPDGVVCTSSGALKVKRDSGSISIPGLLTDAGANFITSNVLSGDFLYVYNNLPTGDYVESCGFWQVTNVTATTLAIQAFNGQSYSGNNMSYIVVRPISYTSNAGWGDGGPAVMSGGGNVNELFRPKDYTRFANLEMRDMVDVPANGCTNTSHGCIWDNNARTGIFVDGVTFRNIWSGLYFGEGIDYLVFQNCTVTNYGGYAVTPWSWCLVQNSIFYYGGSAVRNCGKYGVVRFNTILHCSRGPSSICGIHADGIGPIFSGSSHLGQNQYGWIYGNWVEDAGQGIYLTYSNDGSSDYTIVNNVVIGYFGNEGTGTGAAGIAIDGAPRTRIYNNVITGTNNSSGWVDAVMIGAYDRTNNRSINVEFVNNILYNSGTRSIGTVQMSSDSNVMATLVARGNFFYQPRLSNKATFGIGNLHYTFVQWQALGFDNSGFSAYDVDPGFVNINGDSSTFNLHLKATSAALSSPYSLPVNLRDAAGVLRLASSPWDRGAYQITGPSPAPPRNLRVK